MDPGWDETAEISRDPVREGIVSVPSAGIVYPMKPVSPAKAKSVPNAEPR